MIPKSLLEYNKFKLEALVSVKETLDIIEYICNLKLNKELSINIDLSSISEDSILTKAIAATLVSTFKHIQKNKKNKHRGVSYE